MRDLEKSPSLDRISITRTLAAQPQQLLAPNSVVRWMAALRSTNDRRVAILELAGRDSIAAGVQAFRDGIATHFVPTVVFNGATRGCATDLEFALDVLTTHVPRDVVSDLVLVGDPSFWEALCVRNLGTIIQRFGFFPGFIGCHLYVHLVQVPLCRQLRIDQIITGERELHDREIKLTQTPEVLDAYVKALDDFGIVLTQPLRKVESGSAIEATLAPRTWAASSRQLRCVLSGGYRDVDGGISYGPGCDYSQEGNIALLRDFAMPAGREYIERLSRAENVDAAKIAAAWASKSNVDP